MGRRREIYLLLFVLAFLTLFGCGSGSSSKGSIAAPVNSSTPNTSFGDPSTGNLPPTSNLMPASSTPQPRFAYQVFSGFQLDPVSGAVSPVPVSSAQPLNGDPNGFAPDPSGRFLYISYQFFNAHGQSYGQQGLQEFTLDPSTGALAEVQGSPLSNVSGPLITNPSGTLLYVGSTGVAAGTLPGGTLSIYAIDQQSGALTLSPGHGPTFGGVMAMDPMGRFLFTAGGGVSGNEIGVDELDPDTGAGVAVGPSPATGPDFIRALAVDPAGKFLFALGQIGAPAMPAVQPFAINSDGTLTPGASPISAGQTLAVSGYSATVDASGRFLYVVTDLGLDVRGYAIDPATGAIVELAISPVAAPQLADPYTIWQAITADRTLESVYLSSNNGPIIYNVNTNTGALTPAPQAALPTTGNSSYFIAVVP